MIITLRAVDDARIRFDGSKFLLNSAASTLLGTKEIDVKYNLSASELQAMSAALRQILGSDRVQLL